MHIHMKPFTAEVKQMYENHGHFHDGDAGLDLFVINEQTIRAGESTLIHLQISCENTSATVWDSALCQCNDLFLC